MSSETTSSPEQPRIKQKPNHEAIYLLDEEYLVTALVPSETACLASSPGKINLTAV
jgi:hypothetical protein